jgi:ABC-type multidrug transport system ATPase subunit
VEATCGRAVILIDGHVRADGALEELTRSLAQVVTVRPDDATLARELLAELPNVAGVDSAALDDGFYSYRLRLQQDEEMGQAVADAVRAQGWPLRELRRDDRSLEQVFRELTETAGEVAV